MHNGELVMAQYLELSADATPYVSCKVEQECYEPIDVVQDELNEKSSLHVAQREEIADFCAEVFGSSVGNARIMQIPLLKEVHKTYAKANSMKVGRLQDIDAKQCSLHQEPAPIGPKEFKKTKTTSLKSNGAFTCSRFNSENGTYECEALKEVTLLDSQECRSRMELDKNYDKNKKVSIIAPMLSDRGLQPYLNPLTKQSIEACRFSSAANRTENPKKIDEYEKLLVKTAMPTKQLGIVFSQDILDLQKLEKIEIVTQVMKYEVRNTNKVMLFGDLAHMLFQRFIVNVRILGCEQLTPDLRPQRICSSALEMVALFIVTGIIGNAGNMAISPFNDRMVDYLQSDTKSQQQLKAVNNWRAASDLLINSVEKLINKWLLIHGRLDVAGPTEKQVQEAKIVNRLLVDYFIKKVVIEGVRFSDIMKHFRSIATKRNKKHILTKITILKTLSVLRWA